MTKGELAKEIIEKYIAIALTKSTQFSKRYLATVLFNENPDMFKDVEDARKVIRYELNAAGSGQARVSKEDLARQFALIPSSIKEVENTEPYVMSTSTKKTLMIADIHGRFCDRKALEMSINYGLKSNCDSVLIDGDFLDQYQFSKFDKNPSLSIIFEEQEWGQEMLQLLQSTFGQVVMKSGNHDIRRELQIQRLSATMPELMSMAKYSDYLFFDGCHVDFVEDYRHIKYGKLNVIHGHEIYGSGGIHVAHNRFNKALDNILSAHSHKPQSVIRPDINGHIFGSWALGCLCGLKPRYSPMNDWSNGFAIASKDSTGEFEIDNRVIYGNKTFPV